MNAPGKNDSRQWSPPLRDFIAYHETVKNHSRKTCDEYYYDLRHFFRFLKVKRGLTPESQNFDEIDITDVDRDFLAAVTLSEVYAFLTYLNRERVVLPDSKSERTGINAASRARKVACLRSFFKYLTVKVHLLDENPVAELDAPRARKSLPKYLTIDQCLELLDSVSGRNKERDKAILTVFIVCGLRISELAGLDVRHLQDDCLRVRGKGNKERVVFLNDMAIIAINDYLKVRSNAPGHSERALFLSSRGQRISVKTIDVLVKKHLAGIGLFDYSAHKLRHTAATLMLNSGANIRTVQEVLGHEHLNTTEIYTHITGDDVKRAAARHPLTRERADKYVNEK